MIKSKGSKNKNSKSDELLINNVENAEMQLESIDMDDNIIPDEYQINNPKDKANDSKSGLRQISDSIQSKIQNMKIKKDGFEQINDDDHSDDKDDIISPNIDINTTNTSQPIAINQTLDLNICHSTFRCTKTKTIVCLLTILLCFLILFIFILVRTFQDSDAHKNQFINCMNGKKVLIISLDGFRAEYITGNRISTQNIDKYFMNEGVFVKLKPVFPSKTFPNHYSIVTGLYPPSHGIVYNHFWDPTLQKTFDIQTEGNDSTGQWFKGEPIWNTIKQNNLTSAGLQYPGTNANCGGRIINGTDLSGYPTYYKPIYHFGWPFQDRINLTIDLLNSNDPNYDLVLLYFEQPDHDGHAFGPMSDKVVNTVQLMDEYIGKLMTQMEENGLLDITDVILLSDHGMTSIEKYNPETYLNEDSKIIVINESVFPFDEVIIRDYSPVMGVYLKENSERFSDVNKAMDLMRDAMVHNGDKAGIYSNGNIPYVTYNNIESDRIPDFIVDAELGYMFYVKGYYSPNTSLGTHGYNNSKEDMFGIFMARGPSFKNGYVVDDNYLENIHLYEMFCKLLCNVKPNDNNGTAGVYSRQLFDENVNSNW